MPDSADTRDTRRKTIGLLIRRSRETAGRTRKDCATFAGISPALLLKYEEGEREPSLVEVEALAHYLRVPVQALLDEEASARLIAPRMNFNVAEVAGLRRHIIGTRLKQARLKVGLSSKQLAEQAGMTTAVVNAYELGKRPIPISELERLASCLNLSLEALMDIGIGPLGDAQLQHQQHAVFDCLPDDVRAFVCAPDALPYLRVAMRLSKLPADELRGAGHTLIELSEAGSAS
jgi:transcriptional regulator with XRE-family HTH domain